MNPYSNVGLTFENYKSFGSGLVGFERIAAVNVIVGRNNSGKSALIDVIEFANNPTAIPAHLHHENKPSRIALLTKLNDTAVKAAFPANTSGGPISGNHWEAAKGLVESDIKIELLPGGHLTAQDPSVDAEDVVKILRVNRNAIVMIDSDKAGEAGTINKTKERIVEEFRKMEAMAWVTIGREVENYLSLAAIKCLFPNASCAPGQFEDFARYLDGVNPGEGNRFERNKVLFAEKIIPCMGKDDLNFLDLSEQAGQAVARIRKWNGL